MKARRALERRRLAYAATSAGLVTATMLLSQHSDRQRRCLQSHCQADTVDAALDSLQTSGVGVLHGVVDKSIVRELEATELYRSMPTRTHAGPTRRQQHARRMAAGSANQGSTDELTSKDELVAKTDDPAEPSSRGWRVSAAGRYHKREERFDEATVELFERIELKLWPLVRPLAAPPLLSAPC